MSRKTGRPSYALKPPTAVPRRVPLLSLIAGVVMAAVVAGLAGYLIGRPDSRTRAVAAIRAQEAARDLDQIKDLTARARESRTTVTAVLAELDAALDGGEATTEATVREWQAEIDQVAQRHADRPSGTTATNVARGSLRSAIGAFDLAVDLYGAAQSAPPEHRPALLELVQRARTDAVTAWSVAATQLDQINVDAGLGHQHVYLEAGGEDAIAPDLSPEGTG
jgi:hypothetical protein